MQILDASLMDLYSVSVMSAFFLQLAANQSEVIALLSIVQGTQKSKN